MFITTPVVLLTVNRLHRQGAISAQQRRALISKDLLINSVLLSSAIVMAIAILMVGRWPV